MVEATEPTNIIWENRHFTAGDRFKRSIHAFLLIMILVLVSFALICACKITAINVTSKYPIVNC
jgi:hypothetical protein